MIDSIKVRREKTFYWLAIGVYTCFLYFLLEKMRVGAVSSDLPMQIQYANENDQLYSISYLSLKWLSKINPSLISWLYVVIHVATVVVTRRFFDEIEEGLMVYIGEGNKMALALSVNIATPIYIPFVYEYFCKMQIPYNMYHNVPYTMMKLLAVMTMIAYMRIDRKKKKGERVTLDYVYVSLVLFVSTWAKPSFFFVFVIAYGVVILRELICGLKGQGIWGHVIKYGMVVVPSIMLMGYQYFLSYVNPSGTDGSGVVTFGISPFFIRGSVGLKLFCSYCFIVLAAICIVKYRKQLWESYNIFLQMALYGLLMMALIYEEGTRVLHGNFSWNAYIGNFLLFAISAYFLEVINKSTWRKSKSIGVVSLCAKGCLVYQTVCGIIWMGIYYVTGHY